MCEYIHTYRFIKYNLSDNTDTNEKFKNKKDRFKKNNHPTPHKVQTELINA